MAILVTEYLEALFVGLSVDTKLYFLELHISAVIMTNNSVLAWLEF